MSTYDRENPIVAPHSGADFAADINQILDVMLSSNASATRPANATAGLIWPKHIDANTHEISYFDGTVDIMLVTIDPTTGSITALNTFFTNAANMSTGTLDIARLLIASQGEAEAGTISTKNMTPLRVAQAIAALAPAATTNAASLTTGTLNIARLAIATQTEAEEGTIGTKSMTPQRTAQAIAALAVGAGIGQTWQDVSGSRSGSSTSYQNTTGKPITMVSQLNGGLLQVSVDDTTWVTLVNPRNFGELIIIPDTHYYRYTGTTISLWAELR